MEKNKLNELEVLGFDPKDLFNEMNNNDDNNNDDDYENIKREYESIKEYMNQDHIKKCYKKDSINCTNPTFVYLAGKIKKNGWRESIVGYRCNGLYGGDGIDLKDYYVRYNENIVISGPWFLACDHGCYHGDNSHGLGVCQLGCNEADEEIYTENEVYDICLHQIKCSDIVFAYIDDATCYGSIYEIGWARAMKKDIVIIFDNEKLMSDMWFMCQDAKIVDVLGNKTIKEKFDEILC